MLDMNVLQIRLNAWHYADSILWASLAVEIFERLADPEPVDRQTWEEWVRSRGDPDRGRREELLGNLESYRRIRRELNDRVTRLEQEKLTLGQAHAQMITQRASQASGYPLTDIAGELASDSRVREALSEVGAAVGAEPAVDELTSLASELRTTSGYLPAVWRAMRGESVFVGLLSVALVLAFVTTGMFVWLGSGGSGWVAAIPALASVGSFLTAAKRHLLPATEAVNTALRVVESAVMTATSVHAELAARRSREERELASKLHALDQQIEEKSRELSAADQRIATTKAEAEALAVGRQLYDFLTESATGYQKQQGVIGMLHRDFRQLDAKMSALRAQRGASLAQPNPNYGRTHDLEAIDRVVLYIDDLDRCPPDKVLEVLEAVHLLLALELFVVVVGVDPRWLERSLRHQYRHLVRSGNPDDDVYLQLMPLEYLEKIFQIPLALPEMEEGAYKQLVLSLAPGARPSVSEPAPRAPAASHTTVPGQGDLAEPAPTRVVLEVQDGSAASGEQGSTLDLTTPEVEFAQRLGLLVATPRAAKRLLNTYRFIRATQHVGSRSRFLGSDGQAGEYQALLTLLAIAAGYPSLSDPFLLALERASATDNVDTWRAFIDALDPAESGALLPSRLQGHSDDPVTLAAAAEWAEMHERLSAIDASLGSHRLADLEAYRRWGPIAARFSFKL